MVGGARAGVPIGVDVVGVGGSGSISLIWYEVFVKPVPAAVSRMTRLIAHLTRWTIASVVGATTSSLSWWIATGASCTETTATTTPIIGLVAILRRTSTTTPRVAAPSTVGDVGGVGAA